MDDNGVSLVIRTRLRKDISREGPAPELSGLYSSPSPTSDSEVVLGRFFLFRVAFGLGLGPVDVDVDVVGMLSS